MFLLAFGAGAVLVLVVTCQYADVADRRWRSVLWEPIIAACAVMGIGGALSGWQGAAGYILGSTAGCWLAMVYLRRGIRRK